MFLSAIELITAALFAVNYLCIYYVGDFVETHHAQHSATPPLRANKYRSRSCRAYLKSHEGSLRKNNDRLFSAFVVCAMQRLVSGPVRFPDPFRKGSAPILLVETIINSTMSCESKRRNVLIRSKYEYMSCCLFTLSRLFGLSHLANRKHHTSFGR